MSPGIERFVTRFAADVGTEYVWQLNGHGIQQQEVEVRSWQNGFHPSGAW